MRAIALVVLVELMTACTGGTGSKGDEGHPGVDGATGPRGPAGVDGAMGLQGPAGVRGAIGPQGPAGSDGAIGPQGPAGSDGAIGPQGPAGATGLQGPAGSGPARYKVLPNKDLSSGNLMGTFVLPAGQWWLRFTANGRTNFAPIFVQFDSTSDFYAVPRQVLLTCWMEAPSIYIGGLATATDTSLGDSARDTWTPLAAEQLVGLGSDQTFVVKCEPWNAVGQSFAADPNQVEIRDFNVIAIATGPISSL